MSREQTHRAGKKKKKKSKRPPKAMSAKAQRPPGVNDRKIKRTLIDSKDISYAHFNHVSPPVRAELVNIAIGEMGDKGGLSVRVSDADAERMTVVDWMAGLDLSVQLELAGEPEKLTLEGSLIRVDECPEDNEYELGIQYKPVPRAYHLRLEKFWDRVERGR
jgi:hypothetical protein